MCWEVHINGKAIAGRNDLESAIGGRVTMAYGSPRTKSDHCLCSVDVPETLISHGYWVRSALGLQEVCGDLYARKVDDNEIM